MGLEARERGRDFQLHGLRGEREREGGTSATWVERPEGGRDFQLHGFRGERGRDFQLPGLRGGTAVSVSAKCLVYCLVSVFGQNPHGVTSIFTAS